MVVLVEVFRLDEAAEDESYEPMWTCQGVLRGPRRRRAPDSNGMPDYYEHKWDVPDYDRWAHVPGFPDFLGHPELANPAFVRPMTAEERRAYLRGKVEAAAEPRGMELMVRMASLSIEIDGKVVGLSPREHELLVRTIEESPLSHKRAVQFLEAVESKSPGAVPGFVDPRALADHRKSVLAKVEREVGRQARVLLAEAFRSRSGELVYDSGVLPVGTENGSGG